ncbi:MAG TPA: bifunctional 2-polyprenyl-6-hydroxyphenol methylase/3-demethylubiquinol 3-O-methyltransferase UbiG [Xanthomonadaceae bacterium]|nr:bifunctional 2-polyprenyl-6-hydroxyphenol methylase/3-demethylubiquinol 3-O-methyltransferase UbiG [Xanthomonadaceae bacterium]
MTDRPASGANVDPAEIARFDELGQRWWDPEGPMRPLHDLNPVRLDFVRERIDLRGAAVADVGCGGGLLSEVLAGEGARVTAIDLAPQLLEVARLHGLESGVEVEYLQCDAAELARQRPGAFDAVTCMELIEHVPDPAALLADCAHLLRPGGALFVSTLNRTPEAFAVAIVGAEYLLRLLPRGTHRYREFVRPSELAAWLREAGCRLEAVAGLQYQPWSRSARLGGRPRVNYLACARREAER